MSINTETIYLDESGATGNHLMDQEQPFFVYASLGLEQDEASAIHSEMVDRFQIQGPELKGISLTKRQQGREAILWLWREAGQRSKIAVAEKVFALAGKFFEYMFEPSLASHSSSSSSPQLCPYLVQGVNPQSTCPSSSAPVSLTDKRRAPD